MSVFNLQASYFAIENPLRILDRWLNRFQLQQTVNIGQREVRVRWTRRAERELCRRESPLMVELQLYFSCVVKKRVLFHDRSRLTGVRVNDSIQLAFRPLASAACDPREFAANYPVGRDLSRGAAAKMVPRLVEIDFRRAVWEGSFSY